MEKQQAVQMTQLTYKDTCISVCLNLNISTTWIRFPYTMYVTLYRIVGG